MRTAEVRDLLRRADALLDPLGDPHGDLDRLFGRDHGRDAPTSYALLYGYGGRTAACWERFPENEDRPDLGDGVEERAVPVTPETLEWWDADARSDAEWGRRTGEALLHRGGDTAWVGVDVGATAQAMREFGFAAERVAVQFAGYRQLARVRTVWGGFELHEPESDIDGPARRGVFAWDGPSAQLSIIDEVRSWGGALRLWDRVYAGGWAVSASHEPEPPVPAPAPPLVCAACECAPTPERPGATPVLADPWVSAAAWRRPGEATYVGTGAAGDVAEANRRAAGAGPARRSRRERGW